MMKMFALGMLLVPMVVAAASTVKNLDDCFPRAVGGVMLVEKKPQPEVVVGAASQGTNDKAAIMRVFGIQARRKPVPFHGKGHPDARADALRARLKDKAAK